MRRGDSQPPKLVEPNGDFLLTSMRFLPQEEYQWLLSKIVWIGWRRVNLVLEHVLYLVSKVRVQWKVRLTTGYIGSHVPSVKKTVVQ